VPCQKDDSLTAAQIFAERVMFDVAGVCVVLSSDRAPAFVYSVVEDLSNKFGMHRVLGTAYHPESQSAVERPHQEYKKIGRLFMEDFKNDWDQCAAIFQWNVRTTAKIFSASYTPYETLFGMKPRQPSDALLQQPAAVQKIGVEDYVVELIRYMKKVHSFVTDAHQRKAEASAELQLRRYGVGARLDVGDYVLVKRGSTSQFGDSVSSRFVTPNYTELYQIVEAHGNERARAFTLCDAATGRRDNLGFSQPVTGDRLIPVELMPLAKPSSEGYTQLRVGERLGEVVAQAVDGRVHIKWDDAPESPEVIDLANVSYQWIS